MKSIMIKMIVVVCLIISENVAIAQQEPNIILIMADDLGWGDVGFNGHEDLKTPHLDAMAQNSLQLNRFYAASAVCSPTRGSVLTGRHPERYGITFANQGHLKKQEVTIAEVLKTKGYRTGHFGKWHLGTLTKDSRDGRRGGRNNQEGHYSPPWENGFDVSFTTEMSVGTWDPMENQPFPSKFWTGPGEYATDNLDGDVSRIVMDRVIPFIEESHQKRNPFLAVVWLHPPHSPVKAGPPYLEMYTEYDENKQHYYGILTAMDEQVGRLRKKLRELNIEENTLLFFTSDNGPAGQGGGVAQHPGARQQGSPGPYRGRKGSLYEGGIRVPSLIEWPARIKKHREVDFAGVTSDYYPTILDVLSTETVQQPAPLDGISLLPLIDGDSPSERAEPIGFYLGKQRALMNGTYKLYSGDDGETYELYNLAMDKKEQHDIAGDNPVLVANMKAVLETWITSHENSAEGNDY